MNVSIIEMFRTPKVIKLVNALVINLTILAFVLSDWTISYFSFGDLILIPTTFILILKTIKKVTYTQMIIFLIIALLILINLIINFYFNPEFLLKPAVIGGVKVLFFVCFGIGFFTQFNDIKQKRKILFYLNIFSLVIIIIGFIVNIALSKGYDWPIEYLWKFSRTDYQSYYFRGPDSLVRMRSLFSEPAHLGYFLNLIFSINLFGMDNFKGKFIYSFFILVGIVATFSYSSIAIMLVMLIFFAGSSMKKRSLFIIDYRLIVCITILLAILVIFRETVYNAIVLRTIQIFRGQDNSFISRIIGSWNVVRSENLLFGIGIANSPILYNIYAYFLTEMGIFTFSIFSIFNLVIAKLNIGLGAALIMLNFQRGGYLGVHFWLMLILIILFIDKNPSILDSKR